MIVVGLTGGIGSGKTTVAKMFGALGVPVYIADFEAKRLMNNSKIIRKKIIALFGEKAYNSEGLDRPYISLKIFSNDVLFSKMNAIIHPKVNDDFKRWLQVQQSTYVIKESAIIFEHNRQSQFNFIITVTAPLDEKILRLKQRDHSSEIKIKSIMNHQLSDEEKIQKSDFVIVNKELSETQNQVLCIHKELLKKIINI